jgi:hypothetical protein
LRFYCEWAHYGGHLLQQWLQEWPHRVISFYKIGHSLWKEVSYTKLQFKDRENPTWRWILDAVGCCFALLRRVCWVCWVCWPALEECYGGRVYRPILPARYQIRYTNSTEFLGSRFIRKYEHGTCSLVLLCDLNIHSDFLLLNTKTKYIP